jgi:amino-acid N-acetyltransferase
MTLTIERAGPGDGPAILRLLSASSLPTDGVMDHIDTALIARFDDHVVGCAALEIYPDGALLRSVAVDGAHHRQGIGSAVTRAALDLAKRLGIAEVYLLTTTAEAFFPKFGFNRIARDQMPPGVQTSVEFRSACPSSATVMRTILKGPAKAGPYVSGPAQAEPYVSGPAQAGPYRSTSMEHDVVCGMQVDPAKAAATSEYNGKTYYFCAKVCKTKFDANPAQYVK